MVKLVYLSSTTNNTERFVKKLGMPACCIPLRPKKGPLYVDEEYVLVVPTYGGGNAKGAVPKQVIKSLNDEHNRSPIRGVIPGGNMNFGAAYGLVGDIVAAKYHAPHMHGFELFGMPLDVVRVHEDSKKLW